MTTDFFQNIASLNIPGVWRLVVETDANGNFTVSELFNATCGDKAVKLIVPLNLCGTAQELDEGFFDKVTEPVSKAAGLQDNMEAYLKSVEQAKAASRMEQDKKNKEKPAARVTKEEEGDDAELPEPKPDKEEVKRVYYDTMANVTELIKKLKFSEALAILPAVEQFPNKENELVKKRQYLEQQIKLYEKALTNFNA